MAEESLAWLRGLAYRAWAEPEHVTAADVECVASLLNSASPDILPHARDAMTFLISSRVAPIAIARVFDTLRQSGLKPTIYAALLHCLRYAVSWRRPLLEAEKITALARMDHLRDHREILLGEVLEPSLFRSPLALPKAQEAGVSEYCSYLLSDSQPGGRSPFGTLPYHVAVSGRLSSGPQQVLVVQNIADRQGDEILRCVPLMQAFLDLNPELEVTILTKRRYLYSHPRVKVRNILDSFPFRAPYDVVVDYFEPNILAFNYNVEMEAGIRDMIGSSPPFLFIKSPKAFNHFTFDRVEVDSIRIEETRGLKRRRVEKNYEPAFRLMAELGLPVRWGENPPRSEPVLAGIVWPEADETWARITTINSNQRPIALLLCYGGAEPQKGHTRPEDVAAEGRRLISQGFFVAIVATYEPWGSVEEVEKAIDGMPEDQRPYVSSTLDPRTCDRDEHGRMLLYFIRAADVIVAVEGWMIHAAYCLAKPYEILMLNYSHGAEWHPYGAGARQEVSQDPLQPRRAARCYWLAQTRLPDDLPMLYSAICEPDQEIRAAAARALATYPLGQVSSALRGLLDDCCAKVRATAAQALLEGKLEGESTVQARAMLQAYILIGQQLPDWQSVVRLGVSAREAVEATARDENEVLRREAATLLGYINKLEACEAPVSVPKRGTWRRLLSLKAASPASGAASGPKVLILTPMKDAADCISAWVNGLRCLTYPHEFISIGVLESDSTDNTLEQLRDLHPYLNREFRRMRLWKDDFGFQIPEGRSRWDPEIQAQRRTVLAKSRNRLLFHSLDDEDWVLWLDADVVEYQSGIIEKLLTTGKDIVHPNCVLRYGGPAFDRNAWREQGRLHLDDLRREGALVKLDAVGGTMLLVKADVHRDGLIFPPYPYGRANPRSRPDTPEIETEGLGLMAQDMGYQCWGMPYLEIRHRKR